MPKKQTQSKPSRTKQDSGEGLICSAFECAPIYLQFQCSHSVYAKGVETSICYTTTEERGDLIVEALNHFKATGKLDEWVSKRNVKVEARHDEA